MNSHRHNNGGGSCNLIGANEDMFLQAFDSTPKLNIINQKKLDNELNRVITIISNPSAEWDKRVQAIKDFRSLVNSGLTDLDDFHTTTLKTLEIPFQNNICDLRSQVVRETCITIAFLSCRLQQRFSRMAEMLLPSLIKLIPNSAKIMSTSALVALRFIIQSTHNSRLITIIKYQLSSSKSKDIHRALLEIAERIVTLWPPHTVERHINDFMEVLRLGICNSDELARQYARRAFNVFAEHFREPADRLFNSLDQQRQRMLNNLNHGGGSTLSMNGYGGSITSNLNIAGQQATIGSAAVHHNYGPSSIATSNLVSRLKSSITATTSSTTNSTSTSTVTNGALTSASPSRIRTPTARSTSAIDVSAQRRARARAVYLSSMYTRPRQQSGTLSSNASANVIPSKTATPTNNLYNHHHNQYTAQLNSNNNNTNAISSVSNDYYHHQPATPLSSHHQHLQQQQQLNEHHHSNNTPQQTQQHHSSLSKPSTPNVAQQQQQLIQLQQQQAASAEKKDGIALSKAASYLLSVISNNSIAESQIVTTIKYFNSLIEKHPYEILIKLLPELMPPLVIGIDNPAICVRKASVFAMVAIHCKVGLKDMESYLTGLTMTQRKLLEVYIKKFKEENKTNQ